MTIRQVHEMFPTVKARDLEGRDVTLPAAFDGERNLVAVAFRREQQSLVDSWAAWCEARAAADPGFRFYEVPVIDRVWKPVRKLIDGGMASAIGKPAVLRRTLTVYGDVSRLTTPLGIVDRSTVALFLVDRSGAVCWTGSGRFEEGEANDLERAALLV